MLMSVQIRSDVAVAAVDSYCEAEHTVRSVHARSEVDVAAVDSY